MAPKLYFQSKYFKIPALSRALQDDPYCQLLTFLRRYVQLVGVLAIGASLSEDAIPQSLTVKKGLLVLTRQWKNVLYMPTLANSNFKVTTDAHISDYSNLLLASLAVYFSYNSFCQL